MRERDRWILGKNFAIPCCVDDIPQRIPARVVLGFRRFRFALEVFLEETLESQAMHHAKPGFIAPFKVSCVKVG